ncbi:MAG: hypothetical protein IJF27_00230 [Oscillospiraceae bacterium]|nr:hypothetical protein [Oscillospiraceae bacterium]MBQ3048777.1 hypothetical protein [Oscillospiraceae bacterium]
MVWRKLGKALLYPHMAIMIVLLPIAAVFLVYSMVFLGTESPISVISYVAAFYTLTVWCLRIPFLIRFFRIFKNKNKYVKRWREDARLRVNVSLYGTLIWNTAYALLQLGMGFWHRTFWFYSLAGYYILLAVMRFFLLRYTSRHKAGEKMAEELRKYRTCGIIFLAMNLTLALMIFFMVYWNRTFHHHEITTIAMAAYTFTAFTVAVVNIVKYRKYNSPVYSASKAISLASACVSMLTLESTMLTTFGDGTMSMAERRILLGTSGGAISLFIIAMAVYMIVQGTKKIKLLNAAEE